MSKAAKRGRGPVVLVVLDGWGYRRERDGNAIALGHTPTWDNLTTRCPMTLLDASGRAVGLPDGQMGNSEVGHLTMGSGRIHRQDIVRISDAMDSGEFLDIPELVQLCESVRHRNSVLHLLGLMGPGGVHAVHRHLDGALELARHHGIKRVAIHAFLDGRDTPPQSAAEYVLRVLELVQRERQHGSECNVASMTGRYFAMDRDKRWDRTKLAYDAIVHGIGTSATDPHQAILDAYARGETDEFIRPIVVHRNQRPVAQLRDGDGVLCLNFRADRMRQIVRALAIEGFDGFETGPRPRVPIVTMTQYDATFPIPTAFPPVTLSRIVAEVVSRAGKTMFRTAETEKYAHVTYFFNCGIETPFPGEERELIPSPRVATYDLKPEMSAAGITDALCRAIAARKHDFILVNYANGDMVGHTGVLDAAVAAVETVDRCLERVLQTTAESDATTLVTADHGNCEVMIDPETGGPHTAHTTNPVPFILVDSASCDLRVGGGLRDVGPTVLALLGLDIPREMTGSDLRHATA